MGHGFWVPLQYASTWGESVTRQKIQIEQMIAASELAADNHHQRFYCHLHTLLS